MGTVGTVVAVSAPLSAVIEGLQIFVPGRTPSIVDVGAQMAGMLLGLGLWRIVGLEAMRWLDQAENGQCKPVLEKVLTVYALCRAVALLLPLDVAVSPGDVAEKYRAGGIRLVPFSGYASFAAIIQDFAIDIVLARRSAHLRWSVGPDEGDVEAWRPSIGLAILGIAALEMCQVIIMSRVADITQVLSGSVGAAAGAIAVTWFAAPRERDGRTPIRAVVFAMLAVVASTGLYVAYNWSPFDFVLSAELIRDRLQFLLQVPFYAYYENREFKAAADLLTKIFIAAPVGIAAAMIPAPGGVDPYPRLRWSLLSIAAAGFFTVTEFGQMLLPARYPDTTDVLIAMGGSGRERCSCGSPAVGGPSPVEPLLTTTQVSSADRKEASFQRRVEYRKKLPVSLANWIGPRVDRSVP